MTENMMDGSSCSGGWADAERDGGSVGSTAVSDAFFRFLERLFFTVLSSETSTLGSRGVDAAMGREEGIGGVMGVKTKDPDLMV